jgi:hypothetical protein
VAFPEIERKTLGGRMTVPDEKGKGVKRRLGDWERGRLGEEEMRGFIQINSYICNNRCKHY